jgi:hypothetical protein
MTGRRPVLLLILAVIALLILLAILLRACTGYGNGLVAQPATTSSTVASATTSSTAAPTTATTQKPTTTRAPSRPSSSLAHTDPSTDQSWLAVGAVVLIVLGGLLLLRIAPGGHAVGEGTEPWPGSSRSWRRSTPTAHRIGRQHRRPQVRRGPPAD